MTRAELIANAEELIVAAGKNLNEVTTVLNNGTRTLDQVTKLVGAQTGLANACIDLARLK